MRVTILAINYTPEATGVAPYTTGLAQGLAARGHEVHVITAHPHYPQWRVKDGYGGWSVNEHMAGVPVRRLAHYVPAKPFGARRLLSELTLGLRFLGVRWRRPDVVVLASPALFASALASLRARWSRRLATAVWVQDLYSLGVEETRQGGRSAASAMGALESATLRSATGVAVIHERFRDVAVHGLGVPADRVEVIRNWSHVQPGPGIDRAAVRRRLGWQPGETVVLHAGNMGVKQGLANVVDAARLAEQQQAPVRFVLLGDGNQRARLQSLTDGLRCVDLLASLPDDEFREVVGSADVLLVNELAGMREMAVPSKLTTYFATGLPVVAATDAASATASEIEASGGGLQVAAGDPQALLDAALLLRADPEYAVRLGANGQRYRDDLLTEDAALRHFERWLAALVDQRRDEVSASRVVPRPRGPQGDLEPARGRMERRIL
jgi:glycosyltransferase involved in cell wall biosynthesis